MSQKAKLIDAMAAAIQKADSSYFNEDYSKQARAALEALEKTGHVVVQKEFPKEVWQKAADTMRTGQLRPDEHVKNVYETVLKIVEAK
jgi:hypothetical protein